MKKLKLKDFDKKLKNGFTREEMKTITANYGSCTGCEQTTPNGGCFWIDGKCVWVPEIG